MVQQIRPPRDERDEIIAELEAELDSAYTVIAKLQARTTQLEQRVESLQYSPRQIPPIRVTNVSPTRNLQFKTRQAPTRSPGVNRTQAPPPVPNKRRRRRRTKQNAIASPRRPSKSSRRLRFTGLVVVVGTLIAFSALALTRLTIRQEAPPQPQPEQSSQEPSYNVRTPPPLKHSQELQAVVDELVGLATASRLPTEPLSITLIDLKSQTSAGYQEQQLRYPASVVKMFWMVVFYGLLQKGIVQNEMSYDSDLHDMIKNSDNDAASRVVDTVTNTKSGLELNGEELEDWIDKRQLVSRFFQAAGYKDISISQKTYPVYSLNFNKPKGRDLQMWGNAKNPTRNFITTQHAARLLYEIFTLQAVSPEYSQKMIRLLTLDAATRSQNEERQNATRFNPIRGFLSEFLPTDVLFAAKAGWTSQHRHEAAYIQTPDGKTAYILVVFGEDRAYADDWKIFPKMSRLVLERMTRSGVTTARM